MIHPIVILLFPFRLISWPIVIPEISYVTWALTNWQQCPVGQDCSYWSWLGSLSKAWLLWHA